MMVSHTDDTEFKIADFGLASEIDADLSLRCGSPGYVAPEILRRKNYGVKVDLFSLGIIAYIILSGRAPFYGKTPHEILARNRDCRLNFQHKYWSHVSP